MGKRTKLSTWNHRICILWLSPWWYATGKGQRAISPPSPLHGEMHLYVVQLRCFFFFNFSFS